MARSNIYITRMIPQQNIDALRAVHDVEVSPHDRALTRDLPDAHDVFGAVDRLN